MKTRKAPACLSLILSLAVLLVSCAPANSDPLAYQDRAAHVSGTLSTDTGTFSLELTLPRAESAPRRDCVITLTAPETVRGITVRIAGGSVTLTSGEATLPLSSAAAARWLRFLALFSVEGEVSSGDADQDSGTVTVGIGTSPERVFVSFASGAATPSQIKTEDGALSFAVSEYTFTDQTTEGTDSIVN